MPKSKTTSNAKKPEAQHRGHTTMSAFMPIRTGHRRTGTRPTATGQEEKQFKDNVLVKPPTTNVKQAARESGRKGAGEQQRAARTFIADEHPQGNFSQRQVTERYSNYFDTRPRHALSGNTAAATHPTAASLLDKPTSFSQFKSSYVGAGQAHAT